MTLYWPTLYVVPCFVYGSVDNNRPLAAPVKLEWIAEFHLTYKEHIVEPDDTKLRNVINFDMHLIYGFLQRVDSYLKTQPLAMRH